MRLGNLSGRATIFVDDGAVDVATASQGRFGPDPRALFDDWDAFLTWSSVAQLPLPAPFDATELGAPSPVPSQVFAIGLNYRAHADEANSPVADEFPVVFTKYPTSMSGPNVRVVLPPGGDTDWEVELVTVIGRRAERIPAAEAWKYVAGLTVGQDISERKRQLAGPAPQFSMGKSFPGFSPTGPWLITIDELDDPDDLELGCSIDGEVMQHSRTNDLVFSVPQLIEHISAVTPLLPGDVIFTGTPGGVGLGRTPPRYLRDGERLTSYITGIGEMCQTFINPASSAMTDNSAN